jgi:hypothetical protein
VIKQFLPTTLIAVVIMAPSAPAQPAIRPPQLGFAGNADGTLRPVYGVAGNFMLGPSVTGEAVAGKVISLAFSGSLGLLKTDSTLSAFNGQGQALATTDAAAGPALFAFSSDGVTALAYVASSDTLVEWTSGKFETIPFQPETSATDVVVAIALPSPLEATLIVQRNDGIWEVQFPFTRAKVGSQKTLVGVTAPVLALASGELVFSDSNGIVLRNPNGSEVHIARQLPTKFSLQQMDSEWVLLSDLATARRFAIRVVSGREGFYELPEAGLPEAGQ